MNPAAVEEQRPLEHSPHRVLENQLDIPLLIGLELEYRSRYKVQLVHLVKLE